MDIQELINIAKLVGPILSATSLILGLIYYIRNVKRDRRKQTLDYWEKINQELKVEKRLLLKDYGNKIESEMAYLILEDGEEQKRLNKVINIYERLSLGVNIKAYDIKTLNRLVGQNLIDNFNRFEEYIIARRKKLNRPFAWIEFQTLVSSLRKLRR